MHYLTDVRSRLFEPKWWAGRFNRLTRKASRVCESKWWLARIDQRRTRNYFIKAGYIAREEPAYFEDAKAGVIYQPDVYPFAADLAGQMKCRTIIDIGCGRAMKLAKLHEQNPERSYVGVDFGENIAWCKANHKFGIWVEANLEQSNTVRWKCPVVEEALILCSDVVEHLVNPVPLLQMIRALLQQGARVFVLSTPDRDRINGPLHTGPPPNPCHVREWNLAELTKLLEFIGFKLIHTGFTRSNDAGAGVNTILIAGVLA
jgi:2-polyprenyl-3-methyl-5-hydroxy-6-metoxy-1,4-benzoquinol methylase